MQRIAKQRNSLEKEEKQAAQCETYSDRANLIVSNLYAIPAGAHSCKLTAYDDDGTLRPVFVKFNKQKFRDAKEEAEWLFNKARKMRRGSKVVAELLYANEQQTAFLGEALAALSAIEGDDADDALDALDLVKQRIQSSKIVDVQFDDDDDDETPSSTPSSKQQRKQQRRKHPEPEFRQFFGDESEGSLQILVGRNRRQNEKLSFFVGKKGDAWLHARNVPGAHVVVKNDHSRGRRSAEDIGPKTLQLAANLALFYSNHRNEARAEVSVVEPKHVLKPARAPLGTVKLRQELAVLIGSPFDVPQDCIDKRAEGEKREGEGGAEF
jgi:predicted ribosome quality control (RQC) complex YloA/Tae2 family protein